MTVVGYWTVGMLPPTHIVASIVQYNSLVAQGTAQRRPHGCRGGGGGGGGETTNVS